MKNQLKITNNWWLMAIIGVAMIGLGLWVYSNPVENYIALSIMFSVIMFVSGILEISYALSNAKILKGWGWILSAGIFDLILGIILISVCKKTLNKLIINNILLKTSLNI